MRFYNWQFCFLHSWVCRFFRAMSIYMILDNHHFVRLIFQKGTNYVHTFIIGCFHFELLQVGTDSCIYRVRLGGFRTIVFHRY